MRYTQPYAAPILTVDAVIFEVVDNELQVLLMKRPNEPFRGSWALPGGYNGQGETTSNALRRITKEKVGVDIRHDLRYVEQLYTFDTIARGPRGHAVSVTYLGCGRDITPTSSHSETAFFSVTALPPLAFDHDEIIRYGHERLIAKLTYTNAVYAFLSEEFTLTELQQAYETIIGHPLDKRNFRKKFLSLKLIHATEHMKREGAHRPARLYVFNNKSLETLARSFD
jgi:8-oxo-dGTP diphosphatase